MDSTGARRNGTDTDGGQHWGTEKRSNVITPCASSQLSRRRCEPVCPFLPEFLKSLKGGCNIYLHNGYLP